MAALTKKFTAGQAMAEFIIAASTVLVSLFIIIPLFGKLIDMQIASQQAARHATWERTVWFDRNEEPEDTEGYGDPVAVRDDYSIASAAVMRNYSADDRLIRDADITGAGSPQGKALWNYRLSDTPMYLTGDGGRTSLGVDDTPALTYDAIDFFNSGLRSAINFIDILGALDNNFMTIAHTMDGFYTPSVSLSMDTSNSAAIGVERWVFANFDGTFDARGAIIADGWNAQGDDHFADRTDDFVISTVLDNGVVNTVLGVAAFLDPSVGDLDFGYVNTDPLQDGDFTCDYGFCLLDD